MERNAIRMLQERVDRLERRLRLAHGAWALAAVSLVVLARASGRDGPARSRGPGEIVRVRGIVIEDAQGRARLLLGAPVPEVAERKRRDAATGLVVLGEDGADRLQVGQVGGPQMGGVLQGRISPATGLMVNDPRGDERAGFGVFENGQAGWGLDWPGREAIVAAVLPDRGFAGIVLSSDEGEGDATRAMLVTSRDGETALKLNDASGVERVSLAVKGGAEPSLEVRDEQGKTVLDALARP